MEARNRIIVALDVDALSKAVELVRMLAPYVGSFKVGLELLTAEGAPRVVRAVRRAGGRVGYDGKFNDKPDTVAGAARAAARLKVDWFNVHASAGVESVRAAVENRGKAAVYGVTVLTSLKRDECISIFGDTPGMKVAQFARMLAANGAQGIICSAQDLATIKALPLRPSERERVDALVMVTPGIRPPWAPRGDQARIMTPKDAIEAGADYLVIGDAITNPPERIGTPVDAAKLIAEEIVEACAKLESGND